MEEYRENKFENCFSVLYERYKSVRRMRRDGSCFYRAFLFQFFEHLITTTHNRDLLDRVRIITADSKEDLMINAGYEEEAIQDFFDVFQSTVNNLERVEPSQAQDYLMKLLCDPEKSNYLIIYIRWLTACYLKKNAALYEGFIG